VVFLVCAALHCLDGRCQRSNFRFNVFHEVHLLSVGNFLAEATDGSSVATELKESVV
jgi:hypothetical protein